MIKSMPKVETNQAKIQELLTRSIEKTYPSREFLEERLKSGNQLSVYLGIDPTGPDLHLGHSVQLLVLKRFQALGHKVTIVIGGFTAQIGDPSGKDSTRRPLTEREVEQNAQNYKSQIFKILDRRTRFQNNNQWLSRLTFKDVIKLASLKTVQQLLDRDMFRRRIEKEEPIGLHEFLYPIMQGYDSVALKTDGEVGGSDQTFNMLVGRDLEKEYLGKEKFILTARLLVDPKTGRKMMSKSEGNYVSLKDPPQEMYVKVLSLPDKAVFELFELCTDLDFGKINGLKSLDILTAKHELAYQITKIYHGETGALLGREEFNKIFREKETPRETKEIRFKKDEINIVELLNGSGLVSSSSEAKRLISQGAVEVDNQKISNWDAIIDLRGGAAVKIGPKRFFKAVK